MKICITGIAGFIGSQLAKHLVHDGHTVTGIDNLEWGYEEDIPEECEWADIDLLYLDRWANGDQAYAVDKPAKSAKSILADVDVMIHCAANLEVLVSLREPTSNLRINTEGTIQMLEAMKEFGIKNLINFSSACVYGRGETAMTVTREEDVRLDSPHWPYGASKLAAEIYCNLYVHREGINVIHVRPGIVCGPREWYGRALTIFLRRALERKPIVVFMDPRYEKFAKALGGDGTPRRDFVHINDVVAQILACLKAYPDQFSGSRTFNMGAEKQLSIMQVATKVAAMLDGEVVTELLAEGDQSQQVEDRIRLPGEMRGMYLSMAKSRNELHHTAFQSSMSKIIDDEVTWLKGGGLKRWQEAPMKT